MLYDFRLPFMSNALLREVGNAAGNSDAETFAQATDVSPVAF